MVVACIHPFSTKTVGQVILALVVIVASLAWWPPAVQAAPAQEARRVVRLYTWISGNILYIDADGLPGRHTFVVRVQNSATSSWVRLGRVKATRQGVVEEDFKLPSYLSRSVRLQVCLKSVITNRLYCSRARRNY